MGIPPIEMVKQGEQATLNKEERKDTQPMQKMDQSNISSLQAKEKITDPKSKESENVSIARQDSTMMMN